jgi:hypothetical protein
LTQYTNRIAFLAPVGHADACNRAANALGRSGLNFAVRLSADGLEPATHLGGSAVETDAFVRTVAMAARFTPPAEDLDPADWQAVADHLTVVPGPAGISAGAQFAAMLAGIGLQRIEPDAQ